MTIHHYEEHDQPGVLIMKILDCQIKSLPQHIIFNCWSSGSRIQHHTCKGLSSCFLDESICCCLMDCKAQETIRMFRGRQWTLLLCPLQRTKEDSSCRK
jgi:hypothetical protein